MIYLSLFVRYYSLFVPRVVARVRAILLHTSNTSINIAANIRITNIYINLLFKGNLELLSKKIKKI